MLVILLVLCPCFLHGTLFAQIHTTSSANYRSYTTSGGLISPPPIDFYSTSPYRHTMSRKKVYSTAPLQVANGSVKTIASTIKGGMISEETNIGGTGYIPETTPIVPGVPDTPLNFSWDVILFLGLLSLLYAIYLRRRVNS